MSQIKDVAEAAGVSTATVSRVLSGKPHVRPELRERVLEIVKKMNYRPNRVARSLRVQKSNIIGLIVSDIQNPFFTMVSRAVEDVAYEQGMSVFLCNTDEDAEREAMYLDLMGDENVSGLILSPTRKTSDAFPKAVPPDIPIVVIDRRVQDGDVDTVLIDNVESSCRLVNHLIEHGRLRIGALFGMGSTTGRERHEGYLQALKENGIKPSSELTLFVPAREEEGYSGTIKLLNLADPPDCIFTSNGLLSAGAFRSLRENKAVLGTSIAFASFDETIWTPLVDPPVTVIRQPTEEIGRTAIELLLQRLKEPTRATREVILKSELVIRQSCGCSESGRS
jgi:LacI family fructose operon transcriptional repressor